MDIDLFIMYLFYYLYWNTYSNTNIQLFFYLILCFSQKNKSLDNFFVMIQPKTPAVQGFHGSPPAPDTGEVNRTATPTSTATSMRRLVDVSAH